MQTKLWQAQGPPVQLRLYLFCKHTKDYAIQIHSQLIPGQNLKHCTYPWDGIINHPLIYCPTALHLARIPTWTTRMGKDIRMNLHPITNVSNLNSKSLLVPHSVCNPHYATIQSLVLVLYFLISSTKLYALLRREASFIFVTHSTQHVASAQ